MPPFEENTYLFGDTDTGDAVVIDAGGRIPEILAAVERHGLRVVGLLNTHAHIDHMMGVAALQKATGAPFRLHVDAARTLPEAPAKASSMGLPPPPVPVPDGELVPGEVITVGGLSLTVRDTPGHAPGHITLVGQDLPFAEGPRTIAFCGDVIFQDSIGRTDLDGGDYDVLMTSIEEQILTLPAQTVLLSGHGPATTVAREAAANPFVRDWLARAAFRQ